MKFTVPVIHLFEVDAAANEYGLHVVTLMEGSGWRAKESPSVVPTIDAAGNARIELEIEKTALHRSSYIVQVNHTFRVDLQDCTSGKIIVQNVIVDPALPGGKMPGGKGSVHTDDPDDGHLPGNGE